MMGITRLASLTVVAFITAACSSETTIEDDLKAIPPDAGPGPDSIEDDAAGSTDAGDEPSPDAARAVCGDPSCPTYFCACKEGSTYRYRSCELLETEACQVACAAFGGPGEPAASSNPAVSSEGLRVGAGCGGDDECDPFRVQCPTTASPSVAMLCDGGTCADYPTATTSYCSGPELPADGATGSVFLRSCDPIDWLRFLGTEHMAAPTSFAAIGALTTDTFHAAGFFTGRVKIGNATETCFNEGIFRAAYNVDGSLAEYHAACWRYQPGLLVGGSSLYVYVRGELKWTGGTPELISGPSTQITQLDNKLKPLWSRSVEGIVNPVAYGSGLLLYSPKPLTLWDNTTLPASTLLAIGPQGNIAWKRSVQIDHLASLDFGTDTPGAITLHVRTSNGVAPPAFVFDGVEHDSPGGTAFAILIDDAGVYRYAVPDVSFRAAPDGGGYAYRKLDGFRFELVRYESDGKQGWVKPLPQISTTLSYHAGGYGTPWQLPNGELVGLLQLNQQSSVTINTTKITTPSGCNVLIRFSNDGVALAAARFCACSLDSHRSFLVHEDSSITYAGYGKCNTTTWQDPDYPIKPSHRQEAGILLHYKP